MDTYQTLCDHHRRLDAIYETWLEGMRRDDTAAAEATWGDLDRELAAHLEAEETHLLPYFDRFDPAEATSIRGEHDKIRELAAEIGVLLELHAVREENAAALVTLLRAHAAREETKLYPWATRELPEAPRQSFLQRLLDRRPSHRPRGPAETTDAPAP